MKIKIILPLLLLFFLNGCGQKEKIQLTKTYAADEISSIHVQNDSWQLALLASPDENVHISVKGTAAQNAPKTTVDLNNGILKIIQADGAQNVLEQFSFGKKESISISLPSTMYCPVSLKNNSGDIKISHIAASTFQLDNTSGYGKFTDLAADTAEINSSSGDVQISDSRITDMEIHTSSGYVSLENPSGESIQVNTKSGDVGISYKSRPGSLSFQISSGSEDISARFPDAVYETNTPDCKKGTIGTGACRLTVKSSSGTVVIH